MKEYKRDRLKAHDALTVIIKKKKLLFPYSCYLNSVCPDEHGTRRMAYLDEQREISPYIIRRSGNYAIITTSVLQKYSYQRDSLLRDGRQIISAEETGDDNVIRYLREKNRNKKMHQEARVIILEKKEIELMDEAILFFDPSTYLEILVTDVDKAFSFYYEDECIKFSRKSDGNTRIIEELIVNNDSVKAPCDAVLPNKTNPQTAVRGTITSIREAISKAISKKFTLLYENFQETDKVMHDDLLDMYAPFVADKHLIKFSKTKFIRKETL